MRLSTSAGMIPCWITSQAEEEYVLTAVSKGAGKKRIMYGHVLKNCMLPVITSVGSRLGTLVTGSFIKMCIRDS